MSDQPITDPHCGCVMTDHTQYGCRNCEACRVTPEYIASYRVREFRRQIADIREYAESVADAQLLRLVDRWQL